MKESMVFCDNIGRDIKMIGYGFDESEKIFIDKLYYDSSSPGHGNLNLQTEPYFSEETPLTTLYSYLPNGKIKSVNSPTNDIVYTYDGLEFTSQNITTGQVFTKILNAIGELVSATDAGGTIFYSYNSAGKPVQVIYGEGTGQSVITVSYNNAGFQTGLQDPDAGSYIHSYNPLGELISSTNEEGNCYAMKYDALGRITEEKLLSPLQLTTYSYDGDNGLGLLSSVTCWNGISTHLIYDELSRVTQKNEIIEGTSYDFSYEYDIWGNLKKEIWPTGYAVNYKYKNGILFKVNETSSSKTLWQLNNVNARGQIKEYMLGNGLATTKYFDQYGFPTAIMTSNNIQNLQYDFNEATGNLTWRTDLNDFYNSNDDLVEEFGYDDNKFKNRLISWSVAGGQSYSIGYNDNGNINSKSDVGASFLYDVVGSTSGPHAVSSIVQPTEDYLNLATPQEIEYCAFKKVSRILNLAINKKLEINYGPLHQRKISKLFTIDGGKSDILKKKKYFVSNDYEIEENEQGSQRKLHYLYASDGLFAIYVMENNTGNMFYIHKDYQGSYQTITDKNGIKLEELSFDPWGRRRNPDTWSLTNVPSSFLFDRGYTGHEHLSAFGLINMNGRVYDPVVARFLSPDPFIQSPDYTQSYNRYSYGLNNPMKYTDPTGYTYKPDDWNDGSGGALYINYVAWSSFARNTPSGYGNYNSGPSGGYYPNLNDGFIHNLHSGNGTYYDWGTGLYYNNDGMIISYQSALNDYSNSLSTYTWNPYGGNEVYREEVEGGVNITYEGAWMPDQKVDFSNVFVSNGNSPQGLGGNGIDGDDIWVGATGTYLSTVGNVGHNAWWWQDAKGAYRSTKLLQVGSNGKYVQGVQGLRNSYAIAGKAASLTKIAGNTLGAVGVGISVYDMTQNGINVSNSMDAIMGATTFIPVVGWVISGTYFTASFITELSTGKSISEHAQGWVNTW